MLTDERNDNLKDALKNAANASYRVAGPGLADMMVAQWAIESGWGANAPGFNAMGIKAYPGCYGRQLLTTTEWFTGAEAIHFLSGWQGRSATLVQPAQTNSKGRQKYHCQDWFAVFESLDGCFAKRAELFTVPPYASIVDQWKQDGDFEGMVRGIAAHYATSGDYADTILKVLAMPQVIAAITAAQQEYPGDGSTGA